MTREERVMRLLDSHADWLPALPISRFSDASGEDAATRRADEERTPWETRATERRIERDYALRLRVPVESSDEAWVKRKRRHYDSGSYRDLDQAMLRLRVEDYYAWHVVTRAFVDDAYPRVPRSEGFAPRRWVDPVTDLAVRESVHLLSAFLPAVIVLPAYAERTRNVVSPEDQRRERVMLVIQLAADGWSRRRIARRVGVSKDYVQRVLSQIGEAA